MYIILQSPLNRLFPMIFLIFKTPSVKPGLGTIFALLGSLCIQHIRTNRPRMIPFPSIIINHKIILTSI